MPSALDRAARNTIVVLALIATALVSAGGIYLLQGPPFHRAPLILGGGAVAAIALWMALRLPPSARVLVAIMAVLGIIFVYAAELYLSLLPAPRVAARVAETLGRRFDSRLRFQVVKDLRTDGQRAYPALSAAFLREGEGDFHLVLTLGSDTVLPLSPGPSMARTVLCNETGEWVTYVSDEYGFNNPAGLWRKGNVEVALLGDSFAHGACVEPSDHFISLIRARYPGTLNAGIFGAGPLHELAILREYLAPVAPRHVFWVYYEGNDLQDLRDELATPRLAPYMRGDFNRGLPNHQHAMDRRLEQYLDSLIQQYDEAGSGRSFGEIARRSRAFLSLQQLRGLFSLGWIPPDDDQIAPFRRILAEARAATEAWGGTFHLVYLPTYTRFATTESEDDHRLRGAVLRQARGAGVDVVDVVSEFRQVDQPHSLWFDPGTHYNERGNRVVTDAILKAIGERNGRETGRLGTMHPLYEFERSFAAVR